MMEKVLYDKLDEAYCICKAKKRSEGQTIQFMQDYANASHAVVMTFLRAYKPMAFEEGELWLK